MKKLSFWLSILFILAMLSFSDSEQTILASGYPTISQYAYPTPTPHMSAGGKSDGGGSVSNIAPSNNIAPSSNLRWNNAGLVDGQRNCACVNNGSFGPGWNPGEKIVVMFDSYVNINSIALYLGCSQQHSEAASGIVRYVDQYGNLLHFGEFYNVGYINNNGHLHFNPSIYTKNLEIVMSSGGGADKNICFSELEIYGNY
jgi:hypothetical protein